MTILLRLPHKSIASEVLLGGEHHVTVNPGYDFTTFHYHNALRVECSSALGCHNIELMCKMALSNE